MVNKDMITFKTATAIIERNKLRNCCNILRLLDISIIDRLNFSVLISKTILLTVLLFAFIFLGDLHSSEVLFKVLETGHDYTLIEFNLESYENSIIEVDGKEYHRLSHHSGVPVMHEGLPEILSFSALVSIPKRGQVSVDKPITKESSFLTDICIFPSQGFNLEIDKKNGFLKDIEFYETDTDYPSSIIEVGKPAIMRDVRIASLSISPFRYNPAQQKLTIINRLVFKVRYNESINGQNEILRSNNIISRSFERLYRNTILNYGQFRDSDIAYQERSILIVRHHSSHIDSIVNQFAEWKRNKGFIVNEVNTETATTAREIRNYIINAYYEWDNPPEYVVIIGGGTGSLHVPYWHEYFGPGDHPYTTLEGDDDIPDIFIGRISVDSVYELATVWNKIRRYEKNPYIDENNDWLENQLLVGDPRVSGISTINTNKYIKEIMLRKYDGYTFEEVYEGNFVNQINQALNDGVGLFSFRGLELMAGWLPGYDGQYDNNAMTPNATFITCNTLDYYGGKQAEPFFRTGTPNSIRGGVSVIGMTTNYTLTSFNSCLAGGIYDGLINKDMRTMGEALMYSKLYLWQVFGTNHPSQPPQYFHWANLIGDPTMEVWLRNPQQFNISYADTLAPGSNSILVTVKDLDQEPLENVWVTIRKNDNSVLATDYTDKDGTVILYFDPQTEGALNVTATKTDFIPHLGTVSFKGEASVAFHEIINKNTFIAGKINQFKLSVKNNRKDQVSEVVGSICTDSEFIDIIDKEADFGTIEPSGIGESDFFYTIDISSKVPDNYKATLKLSITDDLNNLYINRFRLHVNNADIVIDKVIVSDYTDRILKPQEEANIIINLYNQGLQDVDQVYGRISSSCRGIVIIDSIAAFGDIKADEVASNSEDIFLVYADSTAIPGMVFDIKLELFNPSGYKKEVRFELPFGIVEVTDPFGPDSYGYWCYDDGDTEYADVPVYEWIEIAPGKGGDGIDTGLESDYHDNQQTVHIELPFDFRFYGLNYKMISVCSNGWISFGITEQSTHKNWRLPGALGPYAMVAAFWDNLSLDKGSVYTYYCQENNIFIIQWQNALNIMLDAPQTFQIMLYDPEYYPTITSDGPIKIQYKVFNNVNDGANVPPGTGNWGNFATIGITDHKCSTGLEYSFANRYPKAAKPLADETAILFTTGRGTSLSAGDNMRLLENDQSNLPKVYPNPFNTQTTIELTMNQKGKAILEIYDISGRKIKTVVKNSLHKGKHRYHWLGIDNQKNPVSSGIYFLKVATPELITTKKILLLK